MIVVITASDGDTHIEAMDEATLAARLAENDYGESPVFLDAVPDSDPNYWPENAVLIIQGEIVTPQPEQVVTRWKV